MAEGNGMVELRERFLDNVEMDPNSGCWLWSGPLGGKMGYGRFYVGGNQHAAHRWAYEAFRGPIPEGLCALHACDTPACVNPDHIFIGTKWDNAADCKAKGRYSPMRGEEHVSAKLTDEIVREAWFSPELSPAFAKRHGIPLRALEMARRGITWRHVTDSLPTREQIYRLAKLVFDPEDEALVEEFARAHNSLRTTDIEWRTQREEAKANPRLHNHWRSETDSARARLQWLRARVQGVSGS